MQVEVGGNFSQPLIVEFVQIREFPQNRAPACRLLARSSIPRKQASRARMALPTRSGSLGRTASSTKSI